MKQIFKGFLILLFSVTLASPSALAYKELPPEPENPTEESAGDPNVEAAQQSLRDAAIAARNRAIAISVAAGGVAAFFGYKCAVGNLGACALAAVALSGAISTAQYANKESLAANINEPEEKDIDIDDPDGTNHCLTIDECGDGSSGNDEVADHRHDQTRKNLEDAGFGVDEEGNIKTPQGTYSPSQMTPATLASLGVTPEMQAEFRKTMQEEMAKAEAKSGSGSLTAGSGGGGPATVLRAARDTQKWNEAPAPSRGLASVDGLSVRRGDDLIGIQSADIFDMVHQKYQELRQQNKFLE